MTFMATWIKSQAISRRNYGKVKDTIGFAVSD
jgi:hypothetical protein